MCRPATSRVTTVDRLLGSSCIDPTEIASCSVLLVVLLFTNLIKKMATDTIASEQPLELFMGYKNSVGNVANIKIKGKIRKTIRTCIPEGETCKVKADAVKFLEGQVHDKLKQLYCCLARCNGDKLIITPEEFAEVVKHVDGVEIHHDIVQPILSKPVYEKTPEELEALDHFKTVMAEKGKEAAEAKKKKRVESIASLTKKLKLEALKQHKDEQVRSLVDEIQQVGDDDAKHERLLKKLQKVKKLAKTKKTKINAEAKRKRGMGFADAMALARAAKKAKKA